MSTLCGFSLPAQWEEQSFVQLMFPHEESDWCEYLDEIIPVFENIATTISKYQNCLVLYTDEKYIQNIKDTKNIIFKKVDSDDTWCRDFGALTLKNKDGQIKLLDFIFNGWGNKFDASKDNAISKQLFKDIKSYDFVLEGGSIDVNSKKVLLTTSACLLEKNRNPKFSKEQIEQKLKEYLGIEKVLWLDFGFLEGDDTDSHIDMLCRFIDDDTLVYQSFDKDDKVHYPEYLKMKEQIESFGYNSIALPSIKEQHFQEAGRFDGERLPASYVNFLIINGAVLVPTYNDENDTKALDIFKELFPKRDIIGIDCSKIIRQHGSLHCLTMHYPRGVKID
jgi:agmatine deiminase